MGRRLLNTGEGLLALFAALGVLVLPPAALVRFVGNPLPTRLPDWAEVMDSLGRTGVADSTVTKALALLAWLIWMQLALAVLTEVVAVARRRPSLTLPILPGIQPVATRLVAAVMLLAAPTASLRAAMTAPLVVERTSSTVIAVAVDHGPAASTIPSAAMRRETPPPATHEYIVQRHDSFWSIAEVTLGDGFRWREIRDLNVGIRQSDGGVVQPVSDLVRPGWRLLIPAPPITGTNSVLADAGDHQVARGEHLWAIAEETLSDHLGREVSDSEVDPYWRQMIDLNRDRFVDPNDPGTVFAGQEILLPPFVSSPAQVDNSAPNPPSSRPPGEAAPSPESSPSIPDAEVPTSTTIAPTSSSTVFAPSTVGERPSPAQGGDDDVTRSDSDDDYASATAGLLGVAGTGLAAGIALVVAHRRRARMAEASVGSRLPDLPADLDDLRAEVHLRADADAVSALRTALAEVATHIVGRPKEDRRRRPRLVQLCRGRVEVLLDEPSLPAPDGWIAEASGAVWALEGPTVVAGEAAATLPTLVTIGRPDTATEVLFDLEGAGLTTITSSGTSTAVHFLRSIVLELTNSTLSDTVEIAIVGDTLDIDHDRVRHVDTWDEVANDAVAWAEQSREALAAHRFDNVFSARGSGRLMDGLVPLVVVMSNPPDAASFERFCDLAFDGAAACAVVIAPEPSERGTNLVIRDTTLHVPGLGLSCELQQVDERAEDEVERLIAAADASAQPATLFDQAPPAGPSSNGSYEDPGYEVLVRVLGEMTVIGGHKPLKPKQLGLMTYLALHTDASADRLEEAIWPDPMTSRRRRLHNTVSQVRAALGPEHVPASEDSSYRAGPKVRTDLDLFKRRVAYASGQPAGMAVATLKGALDLVEGPVFSYRNADRATFVWVDLEHWVADTEAKVVEVAWKVWHMCTEAGDTDGAIRAARQGLLASPANTELTDALMRAYLASGDRSSAERVYTSHVKALDELDLDEVAPTTLGLWDEMNSAGQSTS